MTSINSCCWWFVSNVGFFSVTLCIMTSFLWGNPSFIKRNIFAGGQDTCHYASTSGHSPRPAQPHCWRHLDVESTLTEFRGEWDEVVSEETHSSGQIETTSMNQRRVLAVRLAVKFNQAKNSVESLALSELNVYYSAKPYLLPGIHSRCSGNGWVIFAGSVTVVLINSRDSVYSTGTVSFKWLSVIYVTYKLTIWLAIIRYAESWGPSQTATVGPAAGGSVGRGGTETAPYWWIPIDVALG